MAPKEFKDAGRFVSLEENFDFISNVTSLTTGLVYDIIRKKDVQIVGHNSKHATPYLKELVSSGQFWNVNACVYYCGDTDAFVWEEVQQK